MGADPRPLRSMTTKQDLTRNIYASLAISIIFRVFLPTTLTNLHRSLHVQELQERRSLQRVLPEHSGDQGATLMQRVVSARSDQDVQPTRNHRTSHSDQENGGSRNRLAPQDSATVRSKLMLSAETSEMEDDDEEGSQADSDDNNSSREADEEAQREAEGDADDEQREAESDADDDPDIPA